MIKGISILPTLRGYKKQFILNDIKAGIIIAAVSIPISMGYSQIAGLPAIYGLYGSLLPIILFALFSTSREFIFGVDAAPAAIVGAELLALGIEPASEQAMKVIPVITLFTAIWLFVFRALKAGKVVNYISTPVMGGFISGICTTIILMQVPKIFGGTSGTGELPELISHIFHSLSDVSFWSVISGVITLIILLVSKRIIPKVPMAAIVMAVGAVIAYYVPLNQYGIHTLSAVSPGLPSLVFPGISSIELTDAVTISLSVAIVIMAETLLAENSFAQKHGYKIDKEQEILAFAAGNMVSAFTGCIPINGSVSRSALNHQYGGKSQLTGLIAGLTMMLILLFGTGFIGFLPIPILTAIIISALIGATEFHVAVKLWSINKKEFFIFCSAFFGVLMLGTINGVVIGIILSFVEFVIQASNPPRQFLGLTPGHSSFTPITGNGRVYPVENVVIYRFSSSLFFANIELFIRDIEDSITTDTKAVIIDAGGINRIDITASERIGILYDKLTKSDVKFYITEHIASLNEQFRKTGLGYLITDGAVRRTIETALKDIGITEPYSLSGTSNEDTSPVRKQAEMNVQEFVWAFGKDAGKEIERQIHIQIESLKKTGDLERLMHGKWGYLDEFEEDEWLEHLEIHLAEIVKISGEDKESLALSFEKRRIELYNKILKEHPELADKFNERRDSLDRHLKEHCPEVYEIIEKVRGIVQ